MNNEMNPSSSITRWLGLGKSEHNEPVNMMLKALGQAGVECAELEPTEAWLVAEWWRSNTDSDTLYVSVYASEPAYTHSFHGHPRYEGEIVWSATLSQLSHRDPSIELGEDDRWHGRVLFADLVIEFDELEGGMLAVWAGSDEALEPAPEPACWFEPKVRWVYASVEGLSEEELIDG